MGVCKEAQVAFAFTSRLFSFLPSQYMGISLCVKIGSLSGRSRIATLLVFEAHVSSAIPRFITKEKHHLLLKNK
jgi:hypothetical protein